MAAAARSSTSSRPSPWRTGWTEAAAAAAVLLLYIVGLTQVAKAEEGGGVLAAWPLAAVLAAVGYWVGWVDSVWFALLLVAFAAWVRRALWLVRSRRRIGAGRQPDRRRLAVRRARERRRQPGRRRRVPRSLLSRSLSRPRSRGPDGSEDRRPVRGGADARPARARDAAPEGVRRRRRDGAARRRHARRDRDRAEHLPDRPDAERARRGRQRLAVPGHDGGAPVAAVEPARAAPKVWESRPPITARTSRGGSRCTRRPT